MDEQQLQLQIVQLVQAAMQGDLQATQLIQQIMLAAQQGDQLAIQIASMILQVAQAMLQQLQLQQVRAAKFGAKLNYLRQLKGKCPSGYFKKGGKCQKCDNLMMANGGKSKIDPVTEFKCGGKKKK